MKKEETGGNSKVEFAPSALPRPHGGLQGCRGDKKIGLPPTYRSLWDLRQRARQAIVVTDSALCADTHFHTFLRALL